MTAGATLETVSSWKRILAFVLGLFGGILGLWLSAAVAQGQDSSISGVSASVVTVLSLIALAGVAFVFLKPQVAGILLLYAGVGGFIAFWGLAWFFRVWPSSPLR